MTAISEPDEEWTWAGAVTAFAVAGAFVAIAGIPGLAGGATMIGAWYLLPSTYAFALGHIALLAVFPDGDLVSVPVAVVEVGLILLLYVGAQSDKRDRAVSVVAAGWILFGGWLAWASHRSLLDLSVAAALLVSATLLVMYGLHRYQIVGLGQVSDTHE